MLNYKKLLLLLALLLILVWSGPPNSNKVITYSCNIPNCSFCTGYNYCGNCNPSFYYSYNSLGQTSQCLPCLKNCAVCYNAKSCLRCTAGNYFQIDRTCSSAPVIWSNCVTNSSGSVNNNCAKCINGTNLCGLCSVNYYLNPTTGTSCFSSIRNSDPFSTLVNTYCVIRSDAFHCILCQDGYSIQPLLSTCQPNPPPNSNCKINKCAICNSTQNGCLYCNVGYFLNTTSACIIPDLIIDGCQKYASDGTCASCFPRYFVLQSNSITNNPMCTAVGFSCMIDNCKFCDSKVSGLNRCLVCSSGYELTFRSDSGIQQCLKISCPSILQHCLSCGPFPTSYFKSSARNYGVSYGCLSCEIGFMLINSECVANLTAFNCNIPNCLSCSYTNFCTTCAPAYFIYYGTCILAECNVPNCQLCSYNNVCLTCQDGYLYYIDRCVRYLSNGITCNIKGCLYCFTTAVCAQCGSQFLISADQTTCTSLCHITNCLTCDLQNIGICLECQPTFSFNADHTACLSNVLLCSNQNNCAQCTIKSINITVPSNNGPRNGPNSGQNNGPNGSPPRSDPANSNMSIPLNIKICLECKSTYLLRDGFCYPKTCSIGGCKICNWMLIPNPSITNLPAIDCIECEPGLIKQGSSCVRLPCPLPNCNLCLNYSSCDICSTGFYSSTNGTCIAYNPGSCGIQYCLRCNQNLCQTCLNGYILVGNGYCVCNIQNCLQCNGGTKCIKCITGFEAIPSSLGCVPTPSTGACNIPNCISCLPGNATICVNCAFGYTIQPSGTCALNNCNKLPNCLICDIQTTYCKTCNPGYALASLTVCQQIISSNYSCTVVACMICHKNNVCSSCLPSFTLANNQCVPVSCLIKDCIVCLIPNVCTLCIFGFYLTNNNTCFSSQLSQDFVSVKKITCNNVLYCMACIIYVNGTSYTGLCIICLPGFKPSGNGGCVPVAGIGSSTCLVGVSTYCSTCKNGYYLGTGSSCIKFSPTFPIPACNIDFCISCYQNNLCSLCTYPWYNYNGICVSTATCTDGCATCITTAYCLTCISAATMMNGQCIMNCGAYCRQCNGNLCVKCTSNFILVNNVCACPTTMAINVPSWSLASCICPSGTLLSSISNSTCLSCIENCKMCSSNNICSSCAEGFYLKQNQCVLSCDILYCLSCPIANSCSVCQRPFQPNYLSLSCVICDIANCLLCSTDRQCETCSDGFVLFRNRNINKCVVCNVANCEKCSFNNVCSKCMFGYQLMPNASCLQCSYPCATCAQNGQCLTCSSPYSTLQLLGNGQCFTCSTPFCISCALNNTGYCLQCSSAADNSLVLVNGSCLMCPDNCNQCQNNEQRCQSCLPSFTLSRNGSCLRCSDLVCLNCNDDDVTICTSCPIGYMLSSGNCLACPSYCSQCTSNLVCIASKLSGTTLVMLYDGSQVLALCSSTCSQCSNSNPQLCNECRPGYYLDDSSNCQPCSSSCMTCMNAAFCYKCFSNTFLIGSSCFACMAPCITCLSNSLNQCTSCPQGYSLQNHVCLQGCPMNCLSCSTSITCLICSPGFVSKADNCVPCLAGCSFCSSSAPGICLNCGISTYLDVSSGGCVSCSTNCIFCSAQGCQNCSIGYYLANDFTCSLNCIFPCSSCSYFNPSICLSCIAGYSLSDSSANRCQPQTNCSGTSSCLFCPSEYALTNSQCISCNAQSKCSKCLSTNLSICTSCISGDFLNELSVCEGCPLGCGSCLSSSVCTSCIVGYTSTNSVGISSSCSACVSPCLTCFGSTSTCVTCIQAYYMNGNKCIFNFRFQFTLTLLTNLDYFYSNYAQIIQALTTALIAPNTNYIVFNSITTINNFTAKIQKLTANTAVIVNGVASSPNSAETTEAVNSFNSFSNALEVNNNIAGITIAVSNVTAVGGSLFGPGTTTSSNGGLVASIVVPIVVVGLTVGIILFIRYYRKRKASLEESNVSPLTDTNQTELTNRFRAKSLDVKKKYRLRSDSN